jgi:hypothetical protein
MVEGLLKAIGYSFSGNLEIVEDNEIILEF